MQEMPNVREITRFNKVPEVTLFFLLIKIMTTTVGKTGADYLIFQLDFGLIKTFILMNIILLGFLVFQVLQRKYIPWIYWITVVMVSIVGTLITDSLVDVFGVHLERIIIVFSIALIINFMVVHLFHLLSLEKSDSLFAVDLLENS
jgi:uncharacterized membrane-anchored protein